MLKLENVTKAFSTPDTCGSCTTDPYRITNGIANGENVTRNKDRRKSAC